jgi:ABC-type transporter Mla subunit MlaD
VAILPELTKSGSTVSGTDLAELRTLAIAARGEQSFDDWAALRQVVGAAAGRSPDIETILQLSKRIDDIAALIDERDRLQQSFEKIAAWIDRKSPERG